MRIPLDSFHQIPEIMGKKLAQVFLEQISWTTKASTTDKIVK